MSKFEHAFRELLDSLSQATLAVVRADELPLVLQRIADSARELIGSEYAAIGTTNDEREIDLFVQSGMEETAVSQLPTHPTGNGLLGVVLCQKETVRTAHIANDPRAVGFPVGHPPMKSFLGVPILFKGNTLGMLYLTNKLHEEAFSLLDEQLAIMLAAHAAAAIHKSLLLQESREQAHQLATKNRQLAALSKATLAITGELSLEKVLQQIVDAVRDLAQAEYAALGVPNSASGYLDNFIYSGLSSEEASHIGNLPRGLGLLGAIISEQRTVCVDNIAEDPRAVGCPPGHPPVNSFLGVPIMAGKEMLGNLYLANKVGATSFTEADQEIVELLAAQAAIAIQNAQLYEQVSRLAILDERTRIGMDLHDGVIQSIYAVGLTLESARLSLEGEGSEDTRALLETAVDGLNDAIRDIRNFILDLRPRHFGGDLEQGLSRLVREFRANTMVQVHSSTLPEGISGVPTAVSRAIFLTTQGALANVARHAHAKNVTLSLERDKHHIVLLVQDDGVGFDVRAARQAIGHGLSNMRARAKELNGTFYIESAQGAGTTLRLTLPWR
ncbi:MAG: GAF domain-containing sensor histidine kinase [Anaerolineales bacterium]|nr:GAF domain-containing sensor histidine kinase [Anaerolineales bacterium]